MADVWLDTNVAVHFITGAPPQKAAAAKRLFERAGRGEIRLRLCPLIVAELVWTLLSPAFGYSRDQVVEAVVSLVAADGMTSDEGMVTIAALHTMRATGVDFVDAHLATKARLTRSPVASFDRDFDRLGVERLSLA